MVNMRKFMVVHRDVSIPWSKVEENWGKLANVESATWVRTCYNKEEGVRFCVWLAPNAEELKKVFSDLEISWESMTQVEETVPDMWGSKWKTHLEAEATADTLGAL
jgi:hypothetical protein